MTPRADVTVLGSRRKMKFQAVIDTGFDGDLSIPLEWAVTLGLELIDSHVFELADGSEQLELIFRGHAFFQGKKKASEYLGFKQ